MFSRKYQQLRLYAASITSQVEIFQRTCGRYILCLLSPSGAWTFLFFHQTWWIALNNHIVWLLLYIVNQMSAKLAVHSDIVHKVLTALDSNQMWDICALWLVTLWSCAETRPTKTIYILYTYTLPYLHGWKSIYNTPATPAIISKPCLVSQAVYSTM